MRRMRFIQIKLNIYEINIRILTLAGLFATIYSDSLYQDAPCNLEKDDFNSDPNYSRISITNDEEVCFLIIPFSKV